jgi:hypothetical protein
MPLTAHASNAAAVRDCCSPSHELLKAAFTCDQQQQQQQQQQQSDKDCQSLLERVS